MVFSIWFYVGTRKSVEAIKRCSPQLLLPEANRDGGFEGRGSGVTSVRYCLGCCFVACLLPSLFACVFAFAPT